VTQNVKKPRVSSLAGRSLAAVLRMTLAVGLLAACALVPGCSSGGSDPAADPGACSGPDCNKTPGRFTTCKASPDCDEAHGFSCVDGVCSYECRSHNDCVEVGHCDSRLVDGQRRNFCVADPTLPEPGKLYTSCPNGDECADPTLCLGAGPGDLDAYCSVDCASDADCGAGYYCGTISQGEGDPRSVCRQREFCAVCASDADCLAVPNQICAHDQGGEKICTRLCDPNARSCPWGTAATCGLFDDDVGEPTCSHKFGSCHGDGKTCEPCWTNADCPGGGCISSSFTGERWCVNLETKCECPKVDASGVCSNGGCPDSPSGLTLQCISSPKSDLNNTCYAANTGSETLLGSSPQTGCWGPD
jgi:hypothetical protein